MLLFRHLFLHATVFMFLIFERAMWQLHLRVPFLFLTCVIWNICQNIYHMPVYYILNYTKALFTDGYVWSQFNMLQAMVIALQWQHRATEWHLYSAHVQFITLSWLSHLQLTNSQVDVEHMDEASACTQFTRTVELLWLVYEVYHCIRQSII